MRDPIAHILLQPLFAHREVAKPSPISIVSGCVGAAALRPPLGQAMTKESNQDRSLGVRRNMANDASSINVIGNGKATELPHIKGRAIWKVGADMVEVQTPYLAEREASQLLAPHRRHAATQGRIQATNDGETDRFRPLN